ncbi:MAG: 23S rRNA (uracil(1939)-C(5))-methyltransferase RlmD [Candidatus Margulisiibacteriota bacterium]|nr:MAG: 23S rRNA (uracil-5-)-methyltransferase RumA [Candidatus Margulisbacteria bacterium GWD2_39_127]OGI01958.1 MAG: 23S rRNA (uracil-5-)-methyltransferase RumA [Candidatus Margulisbacteria bacterium GWF2_38_17]PZM77288.1 MAG: 23S rRNA (uracil(1939)-C(5))-methyltransferase RlmD [Candidatus Margulisiibacteriota bacterium]HAR62927.1 23S rRNA (uracil(1939)-C(5))-methyltransferase RlmD [Candidatus Margulisiibacteriota bacterium]HCT85934.1 23S rRNA (uracil(1939)-C(5))-methyltransferase RlmD [Candi
MKQRDFITLKKDRHYTLEIADIGTKGEGIGRIDGFTVFVDNAVPGDTLKISIIDLKKNYAVGKIVQIINQSHFRVKPRCQYTARCGSCQTQNINYPDQLTFKQKKVKDSLERIGKFSNAKILPVIGMQDPFNYRNKAQFPVGSVDGNLAIGFYALRSHEIINIEECHIQHPVMNTVLQKIRDFIKEYNIPAYNEKSHTGLLRHVLLRTAFHTGEIMVCMIINGKKLPHADKLVDILKDFPGMKSIVLNHNRRRDNVILGDWIELIWGAPSIVEQIGEIRFEISPLSFFQVNSIQMKVLYDKVLDYAGLTGKETVWDIYCGIGSISLYLAAHAKKVFGIEVVEAAILDAKRNAKLNHITNAEFFTGKAEEELPGMQKEGSLKADVIILDPPRKGCESALLDTIAEIAPKRIVYVSCDPSTFARDLSILKEKGYTLLKVQPVDMFPHTTHIECVGLLIK